MEKINIQLKTNWFISGIQYSAGDIVSIPENLFNDLEKQYPGNAPFKFYSLTAVEANKDYNYA